MAEETQEGQKTLVAFIVGLLIGGMLVWAFSGPTADAPSNGTDEESASETSDVSEATDEDTDDAQDTDPSATDSNGSDTSTQTNNNAQIEIGEGDVTVPDQPASRSVELESATYPIGEGWIGVREYNNDQLGFILGVVRFSESQGLVPSEITLQRATTPGERYAIVIFTEDGDFDFSLANDAQIDTIFDTFVAE